MKTLWTRFSVHSIFVLGSSDPFCDERIAEENRLFGDILQFDHSDTYNNITLSVLFSLHYIHNLSLPIQYVLKTDSDCVVNYPQLEKLIGALSELEQSQLYMGMCDRDKKYNVYEVAQKKLHSTLACSERDVHSLLCDRWRIRYILPLTSPVARWNEPPFVHWSQ